MTGEELKRRLRQIRDGLGWSQTEAGSKVLDARGNPQGQSWVSRRESDGKPRSKKDDVELTVDDLHALAAAYDYEAVINLVPKDAARVRLEMVTKPERRALLARLVPILDEMDDRGLRMLEIVAGDPPAEARRAQ